MPSPSYTQDLLDKIRALPEDKIAEVADFVEFLHLRAEEQRAADAVTSSPNRPSQRSGTIPTMQNAISFDFAADVVLVPFPFTDQSTTKKRPAVVVSSDDYHRKRRDIILMAITSQFRPAITVGEVVVQHWQAAGLIKLSVLKSLLATIEKRLAIRTIGKLHADDRAALRKALGEIIGS